MLGRKPKKPTRPLPKHAQKPKPQANLLASLEEKTMILHGLPKEGFFSVSELLTDFLGSMRKQAPTGVPFKKWLNGFTDKYGLPISGKRANLPVFNQRLKRLGKQPITEREVEALYNFLSRRKS